MLVNYHGGHLNIGHLNLWYVDFNDHYFLVAFTIWTSFHSQWIGFSIFFITNFTHTMFLIIAQFNELICLFAPRAIHCIVLYCI